MFESTGNLSFRDSALVLEIDQGIVDYYYYLLSRSLLVKPNKPRYKAHITIISSKETYDKPYTCSYVKNTLSFKYSPDIQYHNGYYFLPVEINDNFILLRYAALLDACYDKEKGYHITVANYKKALNEKI